MPQNSAAFDHKNFNNIPCLKLILNAPLPFKIKPPTAENKLFFLKSDGKEINQWEITPPGAVRRIMKNQPIIEIGIGDSTSNGKNFLQTLPAFRIETSS